MKSELDMEPFCMTCWHDAYETFKFNSLVVCRNVQLRHFMLWTRLYRFDKTTFIELTKVTQLFLFTSRVTMWVHWLFFPPLWSGTGISQQLFEGLTSNFCLAWSPEDESSWLWESNDFSSGGAMRSRFVDSDTSSGLAGLWVYCSVRPY